MSITDVLLCHDDELEKRRIAFIYYLVPPWSDSDGGTLDLFNTDGQCSSVLKMSVMMVTIIIFESMLISKIDKAKCPLQPNNSIIVTTC